MRHDLDFFLNRRHESPVGAAPGAVVEGQWDGVPEGLVLQLFAVDVA